MALDAGIATCQRPGIKLHLLVKLQVVGVFWGSWSAVGVASYQWSLLEYHGICGREQTGYEGEQHEAVEGNCAR